MYASTDVRGESEQAVNFTFEGEGLAKEDRRFSAVMKIWCPDLKPALDLEMAD